LKIQDKDKKSWPAPSESKREIIWLQEYKIKEAQSRRVLVRSQERQEEKIRLKGYSVAEFSKHTRRLQVYIRYRKWY
jgi:hypothetical protein